MEQCKAGLFFRLERGNTVNGSDLCLVKQLDRNVKRKRMGTFLTIKLMRRKRIKNGKIFFAQDKIFAVSKNGTSSLQGV